MVQERRAYRSWLPVGVLERSDVDRRLISALEQWSAKWFVRRVGKPLDALRQQRRDIVGGSGNGDILATEDLMLTLAPSARSTFAAAMIGMADRITPETAADRALVDVLSKTCLDDLCTRLAALFGSDADEGWTSPRIDDAAAWACDIGLGAGAVLMRLTIGNDSMTRSVRRAMPPPATGGPLQSMDAAVRRQQVKIGARLGRCAMTLADFA